MAIAAITVIAAVAWMAVPRDTRVRHGAGEPARAAHREPPPAPSPPPARERPAAPAAADSVGAALAAVDARRHQELQARFPFGYALLRVDATHVAHPWMPQPWKDVRLRWREARIEDYSADGLTLAVPITIRAADGRTRVGAPVRLVAGQQAAQPIVGLPTDPPMTISMAVVESAGEATIVVVGAAPSPARD